MAGFTSIPVPKGPSWVAAKPKAQILKPPTGWLSPGLTKYGTPSQVQGGPVHSQIPQSQIPSQLATPPAAKPANPGQTSGTSGTTTPAAGGQPVLDATALNNIAENQFKANNSINTLTGNIGNLRTNLQAALSQLAYQQPRDQLKLEQGANQRGALYSSAYNQDLGNVNQGYLTKQTGLTTAEGQSEGGIAGQIQAILGGIPLYNRGQATDSANRAIAAAAANPATGQPQSLTPEQIKYIKAGLAGQKAPTQDKGPWKPVGAPKSRVIQSGSWKAG